MCHFTGQFHQRGVVTIHIIDVGRANLELEYHKNEDEYQNDVCKPNTTYNFNQVITGHNGII